MTEREAFEAWAKKAGWPHHFTSCNTKDPNAYSQESWEVWQAARAQPAQAVPVLTDAEIDEAADDDDPDCDYVCGFYNGARWAETRLRGIVGKEGA